MLLTCQHRVAIIVKDRGNQSSTNNQWNQMNPTTAWSPRIGLQVEQLEFRLAFLIILIASGFRNLHIKVWCRLENITH